jgi:MFS transporter, DHA1 family, staphyloferrin A biosynthesis exporter
LSKASIPKSSTSSAVDQTRRNKNLRTLSSKRAEDFPGDPESLSREHFIRVFQPLRHKNYALFWSSDLIASVGQFVREVALYWLAYEITGSAWALGILGFSEAAPRLLLGAVGGVIVDRYDRLRLLTAIQFLCAIPVFALVGLYFIGRLEFWHMVALETAWSTLRSMNPTAGQSMLRDLVPEAELMSAVSLYSIGFNFARIVGPSIGGVLIIWIGVGGCLLFYGVALLLSAFELLGVRLPESVPASGDGNLLNEFKEGLHYIAGAPMILASILAAYVISIFVGTYTRFLAVFAKDILEVGPDGLGLLMAAPGIGAVFSLIVLGSLQERWSRQSLLWFSAIATPALLILFCFSRHQGLSIMLLGVFGGMQIIFRTVSRLIIQVEAPRELLGRVMSIFLMDQGMRSLGSMVMGAFVAGFGAAHGLAITSVLSIVFTVATFWQLLRRTVKSR